MRWTEVEEFVLEQIKQRLEIASAANQAEVHRQFKAAYEPLKDFEKNISYDLPLTGEAYALKYHLQRMDNMNVALNRIHEIRPLLTSPENLVWDIGSGTGASTMALMRWMSEIDPLKQRKVKVVLSEPSEYMRSVSKQLCPSFARKLELNSSSSFVHSRYNLENCANRCEKHPFPRLDLIIFCYTFWIQKPDEWPITTKHVLKIAKAVKPNGTLIFLTPKSKDTKPTYQKVLFMEHLKREPINAGFTHRSVSSPTGFTIGKTTCVELQKNYYATKHPKRICDAIAEMLEVLPLEGDDRFYYYFSATIDVFLPKQ